MPGLRVRLEELESRLAPASFAVNAQLQITSLGEPGALATGVVATTESTAPRIVFFESSVANFQVLRQGLSAGTDSVVLDSAGDGLREMAAFLAGRHDLTAIGVVAHGAPGAVALGAANLNVQSLGSYMRELAAVGSALGRGGELDLWSCDVAAGERGESLVWNLAIATGTGVEASDQMIGAPAQGGNWQLDVRVGGARGEVPFSPDALGAFHQLLGIWTPAASMATARGEQTATLLSNGKVLVTGGSANANGLFLSSAELYDPVNNTWSPAASMATARDFHTATLLSNGKVLVAGGYKVDINGNTVVLSSAELYDPVSNTWSAAGNMATARDGQTATLLPNGKVLVAGGTPDGGLTFLSSAELYDPVNNTWSPAASMATARDDHTATLLRNGKVLVAGGAGNNGSLSSTELYDPVSNTWSTAGNMATARYLHAAALLGNGKMLVAGGLSHPPLSSAELYDPVNNTWSAAANMATGRAFHTATLMANGTVLVAGGIDSSHKPISSAVLYDPVSNTWSSAGSMASARTLFPATLLGSNKVLVAGGYDINNNTLSSAELYDPDPVDPAQSTTTVTPATIPSGSTAMITLTARDAAGNQESQGGLSFSFGLGTGTGSGTFSNLADNHNGTYTAIFTGTTIGAITITATLNGQPITSTSPTITITPVPGTWSSAGSMVHQRGLPTATLLGNGKVLVTGGIENNSTVLSSAELYDPASNTWSAAASMASARKGQTATLLGNGKVLVTGGDNTINGNLLSSAELYDPTSNSWSAAGSLATARWQHTAILLANGKVLATGGIDNNGNVFSSAELYDPISNTWSSAGNMATSRVKFAAVLLGNGEVLVMGGIDNNGNVLASAELYDPVANTWSTAGKMATTRYALAATLLANGKVLITGGAATTNSSSAQLTAELYDPASNTWSAAGSMVTARLSHTATLLSNGKVLVTGGQSPTDANLTRILSSAELYDPAGNTWSSAGTMAAARYSQAAALLGNGEVLVTGGIIITAGRAVDLSSAELYNPLTPAVAATQIVITNLSATSLTAGGTVSFTVTAEDSTGAPVSGYTGTVQLTSTDGHAVASGNALPASYTFVASDNGAHAFTVMLVTAGSQTITATDQANKSLTTTTSPITVNTGSFSQFVVSVAGGNTLVAGNPFLFTAQAADSFGNPVTIYSGPASVTATATPADPQGNFPIAGTLNSSGFGLFLGNLKTAGAYTLTATAGTFSGTSGSLTVIPSAANYFTVTAPAAATTGSPFNVTVTAFDHFGNIATGYTGTVKLTSTDPAAATLAGSYTFTTGAGKDNGVHTFSATLKSGGSQTITATDTSSTNPAITGSSSAITTRGLVVSALTANATGFTATFSTPFIPGNVSLWGGTVAGPVRDVTLVGDASGPINGSLIIDPTNTSITFKASAIYLSTFFGSTVLPNDTWHVTLVSGSGSSGFLDALGAGLDGTNNGGHANYTTTFTTANAGKPALSLPDFARGPDGGHTINVPNDSGHGIPVTLSNASAVKDVVFTLSYNPALLTPTAGGVADSSAGSTFTMGTITSVDATHATVPFTFHNDTAQNGTVVLGDILANVPNSAANQYQGKELLGLGSITVNGAAFTGVAASGLHVNAYLGDVTGNGSISGLDVATAANVAQGIPTSPIGFPGYRLVDPAIVGDIAGDASIDATAVSDLAAFTSNLHPGQIPAPPTGLTITPGGPDPTLSLGNPVGWPGLRYSETPASPGASEYLSPGHTGTLATFNVPLLLDHPRPDGSTGMTEAVLALTYDPKVLSVSSSDITLGSIPGLGSGWQLVSVVDQGTGQIGIDFFSTTAITAAQAGSLVNIAFHVVPGALAPATTVQLVNAVAPGGHWFSTEVADGEGQFVLSPGIDRLVIQTGLSPGSLAAPLSSGALAPAAVRHRQVLPDALSSRRRLTSSSAASAPASFGAQAINQLFAELGSKKAD